MTAAAPASVTVSRARVAFGRTVALDGVDLFAAGGVVALLGPNGAGKSTLLRCLATARARRRDPDRRWSRPDRTGPAHRDPAPPRVPPAAARVLAALARRRRRRLPRNLQGSPRRASAQRRGAQGARRRRPRGSRGRPGPDALGGHPPAPRARAGAARPALPARARRAGDGPRPRAAARAPEPAVPRGRAGHRRDLHPPDRRGGGLQPARRRARRRPGPVRGDPAELASTATGRVWTSPVAPPEHTAEHAGGDPVQLAWRTPEGSWRCLGGAPPAAAAVSPTLEDAYLLMVGARGRTPPQS